MSDDNAIVVNMPMSIEQAVERYNTVLEFTKKIMKVGKDYGIIPGTDKPTLLKPGAEKLCSFFGLAPEFTLADEIKDFDKGLFYFRYICRLSNQGKMIATGEGSANSKEKKYRYRNVFANKATEEEKRIGRPEMRNGRNGPYQVYVIENTEPFELINTLQKMAQKRALIAATLIAANASEFYTQDVEDMAYIDGETVESENPDPIDDNVWAVWETLVKRAEKQRIPEIPHPDRNKTTKSDLRQAYRELENSVKQAEAQDVS